MNNVVSPAFNLFDLDALRALVKASVSNSYPVYAQFSASVVKHFGPEFLRSIVNSLTASNADVRLHLDHCRDFTLIKSCVDSGWDSVMADFSSESLEDNIRLTSEVAQYAHRYGVKLEGEIGAIPGVEDGFQSISSEDISHSDVLEFVRRSGCDLVAIGIGTAHGTYQATPRLRYDILSAVQVEHPEVPLVLHGGSGLTDEQLQKCIGFGVRKINISTDLKKLYLGLCKDWAARENKLNMVSMLEFKESAYMEFFNSFIVKCKRLGAAA